MAMNADYRTYYEILGVDIRASGEQVRDAFRRLSKILHPDKNDNSEDSNRIFAVILTAYRVLSNEEKRRGYDEFLAKSDYIKNHIIPGRKPLEGKGLATIPQLLACVNMTLWEIDELLKRTDIDERAERVILVILTFLDNWILTPYGFPDYFYEARGLESRDAREYISLLAGAAGSRLHLPYHSASGYFYDIRKRADRFISKYNNLNLWKPASSGGPGLTEVILEFHGMSIHYLNYLLDENRGAGDGIPQYIFSDALFNYDY